MNSAYISGLVKGPAIEAKDGNTLRIISVQDNKGNSRDFKVYAFAGDNADKLKDAPSGKRIILEGRISNDIIEENSDVYQGVISLVKIIAVTDSNNGVDYAKGYVSGITNAREMSQTASGTDVANLNVKNTRAFFSKKKNEEVTLTTFVNVVGWTNVANSISSQLPMEDVFTESSGILVPSEYASKKHDGVMVSKIEVWADEIQVAGSSSESKSQPPAPRQQQPRSRPTKGGTDFDF